MSFVFNGSAKYIPTLNFSMDTGRNADLGLSFMWNNPSCPFFIFITQLYDNQKPMFCLVQKSVEVQSENHPSEREKTICGNQETNPQTPFCLDQSNLLME